MGFAPFGIGLLMGLLTLTQPATTIGTEHGANNKQQPNTALKAPHNAATSMPVGVHKTPTPSVWYAPVAYGGIITNEADSTRELHPL